MFYFHFPGRKTWRRDQSRWRLLLAPQHCKPGHITHEETQHSASGPESVPGLHDVYGGSWYRHTLLSVGPILLTVPGGIKCYFCITAERELFHKSHWIWKISSILISTFPLGDGFPHSVEVVASSGRGEDCRVWSRGKKKYHWGGEQWGDSAPGLLWDCKFVKMSQCARILFLDF